MAKSVFSLRDTPGKPPMALTRVAGGYRVQLQDDDGVDVFVKDFVDQQMALTALYRVASQLRKLHQEQLGVESLAELKEEYRKAKQAADAIRERFVAAKERMQSEEYRAARSAIRP